MPVVSFDECGSTNTEAVKLIKEGMKPPFAVVAKKQTNGRGRMSRSWFSREGASICMSITACMPADSQLMASATVRAGISVCKALSSRLSCGLYLKWPNDLYSQSGLKVSGMLAEMVDVGGLYDIVFGIGINYDLSPVLSEMPAEISNSVADLRSLWSKPIPFGEAQRIAANAVLEALLSRDMSMLGEFQKYDYLSGKRVDVALGCQRFCGTAEGINSLGNLIVRTDDGLARVVNSGEATLHKA